MAPFTAPKAVLSGLKDKFESLTVQGTVWHFSGYDILSASS